jgi:hypothetical protein
MYMRNANSGASVKVIHENVSNSMFVFVCHHSILTVRLCKFDALILYSFALISPWGWRFISETCRRVHVCRWFVVSYKLYAFVGVSRWLWSQCTQQAVESTDLARWSFRVRTFPVLGVVYEIRKRKPCLATNPDVLMFVTYYHSLYRSPDFLEIWRLFTFFQNVVKINSVTVTLYLTA